MIGIDDTFSKSSLNDFTIYLKQYPKSSWYIISDYCFDINKNHDVITFTILQNHEKLDTILSFIKSNAAKDIKNTRTINTTFIDYINSPVFFHFSILLSKDDDFLKKLITKERISSYLSILFDRIPEIDVPEKDKINVSSFLKRINEFKTDLNSKNFNFRLARKILLISCLKGLITHYLYIINKPMAWSWISDRDAIVDKYDGFLFDNSFLSFFLITEFFAYIKGIDLNKLGLLENSRFIIPRINHIVTGIDALDELIRVPDYLAGTLADYDSNNKKFSNEKFETVFQNSFFYSKNHAIIQLVMDENKTGYYSRRILYI